MTVTFIDSPNSVIGKTEALDFTASGDVIAISVGYGAVRDEERVYRDGAFLRSYTRSTKVGNTYSIVRDGGWPSNPQLYVDEAPAQAPTFWTTLYDKDLRTLPNQTVSATMVNSYLNFTADAQPWYFHGSSASLMIVNGQGMVSTVSGDMGYNGLHAGLKVYQMIGYDPTKAVAVQVRLAGGIGSSAIGGASIWASWEQWGYGPGDEACMLRWNAAINMSEFQMVNGAYGQSKTLQLAKVPGESNYSSLVFSVSALPWEANWTGNMKKNYRSAHYMRAAPPDVWPSMESMLGNGSICARDDIDLTRTKLGWYAGSTSGNKTITATHIRVLQRAA